MNFVDDAGRGVRGACAGMATLDGSTPISARSFSFSASETPGSGMPGVYRAGESRRSPAYFFGVSVLPQPGRAQVEGPSTVTSGWSGQE